MRLRVDEQLRKWTAELKFFPCMKVARFIGDALVSYLLANGWSCKGTGCKFSVEHEQTFFVIADKTECAENG